MKQEVRVYVTEIAEMPTGGNQVPDGVTYFSMVMYWNASDDDTKCNVTQLQNVGPITWAPGAPLTDLFADLKDHVVQVVADNLGAEYQVVDIIAPVLQRIPLV